MTARLCARRARAHAAEAFPGDRLAVVLQLVAAAEDRASARGIVPEDRCLLPFRSGHLRKSHQATPGSAADAANGRGLVGVTTVTKVYDALRDFEPLPSDRRLEAVGDLAASELVTASQVVARVRSGALPCSAGASSLVAFGTFDTIPEATAFLKELLPHAR